MTFLRSFRSLSPQKALASEALPQTPMGELAALPHTPWLGGRGAPLPHPPQGGTAHRRPSPSSWPPPSRNARDAHDQVHAMQCKTRTLHELQMLAIGGVLGKVPGVLKPLYVPDLPVHEIRKELHARRVKDIHRNRTELKKRSLRDPKRSTTSSIIATSST